jgi:hypothetical protein
MTIRNPDCLLPQNVRTLSGLPLDEVSVGCAFFGAVTIEPFEVSRWRGGCGPVYGISKGDVLGLPLFLREEGERRRASDIAG